MATGLINSSADGWTVEGVFTAYAESLQSIGHRVGESIRHAADMLLSCKTIFVSGVGKSGLAARKIAASLSSTGTPTFYLSPLNALHGDIGALRQGDGVILLSRSGATAELLQVVPYLRERSVVIVSVVGDRQSPLAVASDVVIDVSVASEACPYNITPTTSVIAAIAACDALTLELMLRKKLTPENFATSHPMGSLGRKLHLTVRQVMRSGHGLPVILEGASFRESLIELSVKKVGCVCVIKSDMTLLGIITDGDVRRTLQTRTNIEDLRVDDVMTVNPVVTSPDTRAGTALDLMENRPNQLSVIPVVDASGKLVGVARIHDIVGTA